MKIQADAIRELAKLLDETGLTEIEIAEGDKVVRVAKGGAMVSAMPTHMPMAANAVMPSDPTTPQQANTGGPDTVAHAHPGAVTSPMVGTAYLAAEPGAKPFVQKGDIVKPGDTLLIIEAMKVLNPIKAENGGTVTHILVDNGKPVEYGDVLMVIE